MNAFEDIVACHLEEQGYWVRKSVKLNISKEEKKRIGLPSMPRPEIDIVALKVRDGELLLVEAKSYIDSLGVRYADVTGANPAWAKRYRLFTDDTFRRIVTENITKEFLNRGLISVGTRINYALAAGNVYSTMNPRSGTTSWKGAGFSFPLQRLGRQ
ncbi:MAG: hypothetical protein QHH27_03310 [Clostridia bacterium]|nr:hypothetical protein [Clostridia bacterium]MDH7572565.1 hypothetical protein [Clostridia bacterium]